MGEPRYDRAAQGVACDLTDIVYQISFKGELMPTATRLRLETAYEVVEAALIEARKRVRLNEERDGVSGAS